MLYYSQLNSNERDVIYMRRLQGVSLSAISRELGRDKSTISRELLRNKNVMKKEYINEFAWGKIFIFIQSQKNIYVKTEKPCKNFIEGIYWMSRTEAQWRELSRSYGKWNSVFKRFNEWSKKDVWNKLLEFCAEDPDLEYIVFDATIVRAHACAAGYGNQEAEGLGRSKGGFTSKIHAKIDALGNFLKMLLTPGQRGDATQAQELLKNIMGSSYALGDKGYDSEQIREQIRQQNCMPVIPSRSNSKSPADYDKHIYKERHVIECFFSKIKHFRRVFSRSEFKVLHFIIELTLYYNYRFL